MKRYAARARAQLTYANVIATTALFIALGGGAWALAKDSVGSREIENGSVRSQELKDDDVRGADIEANAVDGSDVIADSLTGADVNESGLTAGGALTGSLGNAGIADGAVDADAIAALPVARLEIPRDASNCASQLAVASGAVVGRPVGDLERGRRPRSDPALRDRCDRPRGRLLPDHGHGHLGHLRRGRQRDARDRAGEQRDRRRDDPVLRR